jgi:hypothetical protein
VSRLSDPRLLFHTKGSSWPFLVENLDCGHCIPFLGPRVDAGLVSDRAQVARLLAKNFRYPLPDADDLPRVAQFMALKDPATLRTAYLRLLRDSLFGHLGLKPGKKEKRRFKNKSLAETTAELDWAASWPRRWPASRAPSPERPVVFHLNGFDGDPEQERHLVLSEAGSFPRLPGAKRAL